MGSHSHSVSHGSTTPDAQGGEFFPVKIGSDGKQLVGGDTLLFKADLTLDTSAYAAGDSMSDKLEITNAFPIDNGAGILQTINIIDKDDQKPNFDILIFDADLTTTTKNSTWAVSDSDMEKCVGIINVATEDFTDLGGNAVATKSNLSIGVKGNDSTTKTSLWVGTVAQGATTHTASGIHLAFTILRD